MNDKLWMMSAVEAHNRLKKREISATEVLESCIERILAVDGELNALPERCFDRARKVARYLDRTPSENQKEIHNMYSIRKGEALYNFGKGVL